MAENNNENPVAAESPTIATTQIKPQTTARPSHFNFTLLLALLAFILGLTGAIEAYLIWHKNEAWQQHSKKLVTQIQTSNQNNLQQLNTKLLSTQQNLTSLQTQTQQIQTSLNDVIANNAANNTTWTLVQVSHLFQLATLNLQYGHNIPAAIALLQNANQQLITLNSADLVSLQQALANNISALQAVPAVNIIDLLTKLTALSAQIPQLPLVNLQLINTNTSSELIKINPHEKWYIRWRQMLFNSWIEFKKMIVIRHQTTDTAPLMSPPQQAILVKNIQFTLGQAQWAILHNNNQVYQFSLNQAVQAVKQYFAQDASVTKAVLNNIATLQKININPPLPDLSATQQMLNQLLAQPNKANNTITPTTNKQEVGL